ncbi:lysin B [Gordonia phage Bantam]|uniref:Lysin B n=1 Tax=Gordonia phage Bantam TaxID=1887641 RepID=A0A1B3AYI7_9CAUD|nr:lysin B [Gordonia phage Bantam]AOE43820.1 lysin B [Gordonia phage Bantam]
MKIRVIRIRGIGEPTEGRTMLHSVTAALPQDRYEFVDLDWAAQYGPVGAKGMLGSDYETALNEGLARLLYLLAEKPAVIIGYSGGAHLAHKAAFLGHPNIVAAGFVADPAQPRGLANAGFGITGEHLPIARDLPTRWIYNPRDIICCAPADSPLRTISDVTGKFGVYNFSAWGWDIIDRLKTGRWQTFAKHIFADPGYQLERYNLAIQGAGGYLGRFEHETAYLTGRTRQLAIWIQAVTQ